MEIIDNCGGKHNIIDDLKVGDKVVAIRDVYKENNSWGNFSSSLKSIIKDKIYTIDHLRYWGYQEVPWVIEESNCATWVDSKTFKKYDT